MQTEGGCHKRTQLKAILLAFLCFLSACGTSAANGNTTDAEESPNNEAERTPDAEKTVNEKRNGRRRFTRRRLWRRRTRRHDDRKRHGHSTGQSHGAIRRGRYGEWNAQNSDEEQIAAVNALTEQGLNANMVRFESGSVFKEGESGMEHMASFNYGYKLSAVRDWLFAQNK